MALSDRSYAGGYASRGGIPPGVKWLLISQTAVFFFFFLGHDAFHLPFLGELSYFLSLVPELCVRGCLWQLVTYSFLHGGPMHLIFNALTIYFMGSALEYAWGTKRFLQFYFLCVVGGAIAGILFAYLTGDTAVSTVGSSGAGFGLLVAFGVLFAEQLVVFIMFPIKAKYLAMILCAVQFLLVLTPSRTAYSVHIGGILSALAYLYYYGRMPRLRLIDDLRMRYRQWKIERARRKFQVYLRKNRSDNDYIN